jgi:hypothetical protein
VADTCFRILQISAALGEDQEAQARARVRLTLPLAKGGMGITSCERAAHPAYIASWCLVATDVMRTYPALGKPVGVNGGIGGGAEEGKSGEGAAEGGGNGNGGSSDTGKSGAGISQGASTASTAAASANSVAGVAGRAQSGASGNGADDSEAKRKRLANPNADPLVAAFVPALEAALTSGPLAAEAKAQAISLASITTGSTERMQSRLTGVLAAQAAKQLRDGLKAAADKAALASASSSASGAWLTATPALPLLRMPDDDFITAAKVRMRIPLLEQDTTCRQCLQPIDRIGDHAFVCRGQAISGLPHAMAASAARTRRHTHVQGALYGGIQQLLQHSELMLAQNVALDEAFPKRQAGQRGGGKGGRGGGGSGGSGSGRDGSGGSGVAVRVSSNSGSGTGGGGGTNGASNASTGAAGRQGGSQGEVGGERSASSGGAAGSSAAAAGDDDEGVSETTGAGGSASGGSGEGAEKAGERDEEGELSVEEEDMERVGMAKSGRRLRSDLWLKYKGKPTFNRVLDLVIHHPSLNGSAKNLALAGKAVLFAEMRKLAHYNRTYDIPSDQLVPFAMDTWGTIGAHGTRLLQFVAFESCNPTSSITPPAYAIRLRRMVERLAVVLQLANAEIVRVMRTQLASGDVGLRAAGVGSAGE